jgi:hypothetical protein
VDESESEDEESESEPDESEPDEDVDESSDEEDVPEDEPDDVEDVSSDESSSEPPPQKREAAGSVAMAGVFWCGFFFSFSLKERRGRSALCFSFDEGSGEALGRRR